MKRIINYIITEKDSGKTIYTFLREHFYSYKILTLFRHREGSILVNNSPALMKSCLIDGDCLTVIYEENDESENIVSTNLPFEIIYEDDDILVVNKPADMPVHPAINNFDNTLANALKYYFDSKEEKLVFRCINRLDRNTSGLLIVAKHRLAGSILADFMKKREIHREYVAIVSGILCKPKGTVDAPIGRVGESIIERFVDYEHGDSAITHYSVIKTYNDITPYITCPPCSKNDATCPQCSDEPIATCPPCNTPCNTEYPASLLKLKLETGRTHQIRVHMTHIGHPLLGDSLYNKEPGPLSRQALHSYSLEFVHPITLEKMSFKSNILPFFSDPEVNL